MFTIEQIAIVLGVSTTEAYGLVHFLARKGVLVVSKQKTGKVGKPHNLYTFADAPAASVNSVLRPFYTACLDRFNSDQTPQETVVHQDPAHMMTGNES